MHRRRLFQFTVAMICSVTGLAAMATFSIVACEPQSGACGVAVATHNLAVGSGVPFARANVGAGVSQFETNPQHAATVLNSLAKGGSVTDAIKAALDNDPNFDDGYTSEFRQLAVVSVDAGSAVHTGKQASDFAGHLIGRHLSVQGNSLVSKAVLETMLASFQKSDGPLAQRLLLALEAGQAAGGQRTGTMSAALLVSTQEGWPVDVDLRVDFDSPNAVAHLRTTYDASRARVLLGRANRSANRGKIAKARALRDEALQLAPGWDRIWLRASRLSRAWGDKTQAKQQACRFQQLNPVWAQALPQVNQFAHCHPLATPQFQRESQK